jgi:phosphatidylglycerophosphatase A
VAEKTGESPLRGVVLAVATAGGAGFVPVAPGTAGAALALPLFAVLLPAGPWVYGGVVAALLAVGIWAADEAERIFDRKDDGRIVIDEVVGQLVTLAPLLALRGENLATGVWIGLVVTGFVAFRGFDIWKPPPVGWAERSFAGGAGVMLDDVAAGLQGAVVTTAAMVVVS